MENISDEQRQFDALIARINEDCALFKDSGSTSKSLLQFENNSDGTILINIDSRIMIFGQASDGYTIIDADYVEDAEDFSDKVKTFNQFYQAEKEATRKYLAYLTVNTEPETHQQVMLPVQSAEIERYSEAWLKNPEHAVWELHWNNGYEKGNEHYLSQDLYQTKEGEFLLRTSTDDRTYDMTLDDVKAFVFDKFKEPENTLWKMGIEHVEAEPIINKVATPTLQEQLLNRVENEHTEFQSGMKQLSKDEMMTTVNAYEMMVRNEILHHVRKGYIGDELVNVLLESDNILEDIYQAYTAKDSNEFFEHIQTAVSDYIAETHELNQENNEQMIADEMALSLTDNSEYVLAESLNADEIRNMKKHKERTMNNTIKLE